MKRIRLAAAGTLVGAAVLLGLASSAHGAATNLPLTISPNSGLTNGQSVNITGSGFTASSIGNFLECNNASNEPTVALGSPVNSSVAVGCTAPAESSAVLTTTTASGGLSKSYAVSSGTIGPPCGKSGDLITTCPSTDSAGQSPAADAANYPCPPTAAQQAAGVTCVINFGDQAGDSASGNITFQGQTTGATTTTPSTAPPTTAASTPTTAASTPTTAADTTSSPTGALANTGPGPALWLLALVGMAFIALAVVLRLTGRRSWRRS